MFLSAPLGVIYALISAAVWGSADFAGGRATRGRSPFQVLVLSSLSGLVVLAIAALFTREHMPTLPGIFWAGLAGASGALGLAAFYRALSIGPVAWVAPTAAVIGAGLPVIFTALSQGFPAPGKLLGFGLALVGIGLVSSLPSQGESIHASPPSLSRDKDVPASALTPKPSLLSINPLFLLQPVLPLTLAAGIGFGAFFILLGQVETGVIFTPLVIARSLSWLVALAILRLRKMAFPSRAGSRLALLTGVLDAGGNLFFLLARQYTRLDVAVVLASLYPAAPVVLARVFLQEHLSIIQSAGVLVCLAAIMLISM